MKSIILTIFMFIVIFASLHFGIMDVISSNVFSYASYIIFIAVILCAVYFVGLPKKQKTDSTSATEQPTSEKEREHEND